MAGKLGPVVPRCAGLPSSNPFPMVRACAELNLQEEWLVCSLNLGAILLICRSMLSMLPLKCSIQLSSQGVKQEMCWNNVQPFSGNRVTFVWSFTICLTFCLVFFPNTRTSVYFRKMYHIVRI